MQRSGRGHPFEFTPPGQINSPVPQTVGHVIGQGLPSFPVGPFIFLGKKIRYCINHSYSGSENPVKWIIPNC